MRGTSTIASGLLLVTVLAPVALTRAAAVGETCDGKAATIVVPAATHPFDTVPVTGTPGDDVIVGTDKSDTIDGDGGNDTICGQAGDDELMGGPGDDRLFGGLDGEYNLDYLYWGDLIEPGPGDDYVDLGHDPQGEDLRCTNGGYPSCGMWDRVSYRQARGPVTVDLAAGTATGEGTDVIAPIVELAGIDGSAHADHLLGSDKIDRITPGGGDDTVDARGGDDMVDADEPGNDVVEGGPGNDVIRAGQGADAVSGGDDDDTVSLHDGAGASVLGGAGSDTITASGRVRVMGGTGADRLSAAMKKKLPNEVRLNGGRDRDAMDLRSPMRVAPQGGLLVLGNPVGTVRVRGEGVLTRFRSIEDFEGMGWAASLRVIFHGTAGPDRLDLRIMPGGVTAPEGWIRAYGHGGNDWLRGEWGADVLDGGPGRDVLRGDRGRDRCLRGERLQSCETRH